MKAEWSETTWFWPDFRMQSSTRVLLGQTGDYDTKQAFSSGGWFMFRSAPFHPGSFGTLISKMDSTKHDRGWELSADDGFLSVSFVNQMPKDSIAAGSSKEIRQKRSAGETTRGEGTIPLSVSAGSEQEGSGPQQAAYPKEGRRGSG